MKTLMLFLFSFVSVMSGAARASLLSSLANPTPDFVNQAMAYLLGNEMAFEAINQTVILDPNGQPTGPAPGNTFIVRGYATAARYQGFEITASYDIAGTYADFDPAQGRLYLGHNTNIPGISNQVRFYLDDQTAANHDDADSYTDGLLFATAEVCPPAICQSAERGYIRPFQGDGADHLIFRLIESDRDRFGLPYDVDLNLDSLLELGPFVFNAFGPNCIPSYNNCSRESGNIHFSIQTTAPAPASAPSILALMLIGLGGITARRSHSDKATFH